MIDLHAYFGDARHYVGYDDLMGVMEKDNVVVEEGDMVCLHSGFGQMVMDGQGDPDVDLLQNGFPVLNGRDGKLLEWIRESGLAVLVADNYAVEGTPPLPAAAGETEYPFLPLHHHCLFKLGIHLGELWYLSALNAHLRAQGRSRFLMTAPPLRLPGAVGSPANAIATV
jgi:kynurenine formamidase